MGYRFTIRPHRDPNVALYRLSEISFGPANVIFDTLVLRRNCGHAAACGGGANRGGVMSIQSEYDAVREAWTHAVLDALQAADEDTRLEVARILCPAGFEIVQAEPANGPRH